MMWKTGMPPRLLYIGDVPVESTYHGSALLYRLLQCYPHDRLLVVEGNLQPSLVERRLRGVSYRTAFLGPKRPLHTRFHKWYSAWLSSRGNARARRMERLVKDFAPEAVLTVAHGYLWTTAARLAERGRLPLHLIVHDDWPRVMGLPAAFREHIDQQFSRIYRSATTRLCVSTFMALEYRRRYGAGADVLYPSRAHDQRVFVGPAKRIRERDRPVVFGYAGTLDTPDYCRMLRVLAEYLEPHHATLRIFSPVTAGDATSVGLHRPNMQLCGLLKANELLERLRADVDVLFAPMSFEASERANTEIAFPSKLADYTAAGLPILIMGPSYSSAVRWARENPGVAEVIDSEDCNQMSLAIGRLAQDPEYRIRLAEAALAVGNRFFSHGVGQRKFDEVLRRTVVERRKVLSNARVGQRAPDPRIGQVGDNRVREPIDHL